MLRGLLVVAALLLGALVAAGPSIHRELLARLTTAASQALGARVRLDGATGIVSSLLGGSLRVHGLRAAKAGAFRIDVQDVVIDFAPRALLDRRLAITRVVLRRPRVAVTDRVGDALPSGGSSSPSVPLSIERVVVDDGRVVVATSGDSGRRLYGADRVDVELRPVVAGERWHAIVERLGLRPRGVRVPALAARGVVKGRSRGVAARLDAHLMNSGRAGVTADVRWDRDPLRYRVALATDGLALRPFVASPPVARVRGTAVVHGAAASPARLAYTAALVAEGSTLGDLRIGLDGHGSGPQHRIEATASAAGSRVAAEGTLDVEAARVAARLRGVADLAALGRRLDLPLGGTATVVADVDGPLAAPRVAGTIDATEPRWSDTRLRRVAGRLAVESNPDGVRIAFAALTAEPRAGTTVSLAAPTTLAIGRVLELAPTTLVAREGRATVSARLGPGSAVDVALDVPALDLAALCRTLDAGECSGSLRASARLAGDGPSPSLHAVVHHSIGADVVADGRVPFPWPSGSRIDRVPLSVDMRSTGFDAAALQPFAGGAITKVAGRLDAAIHVAGPLAAPSIDGSLRLRAGQLEPAATRVLYRDVELSARLVPGSIVIDALSAHADGTLRGRGRIALDRFTPGALDVALALDAVRVLALPQYEATANGTLAVAGTASAPRIEGDVVIGPAVARPAGLSSGAGSTEPDPTIEIVGRAAPPPAPSAAPALADALALDLDVRVGDGVTVRRSDARIDLGGRLAVTKASGEALRVNGVVRLVRGWATFQSRRFTLEPSAIRFDGAPAAPTLDITATSRAGQYEVEVRVSGRPDKPVLALSSEPPLSESDVLAVLLFGAPTQELGQSQQADLQQRAVGLASTYVAGGLTRSVRDALGLDVLDVSAGEGDRPGEVRIGRYVTNDIFLSIAQEFGSRVGQAAGVEYRLRPRISVRLSTSTSGSSGIDVLWHRRY